MSEQHTQGQLHVCSHSNKVIRNDIGTWVADCNKLAGPTDGSAANAARLVACWNIAEGMQTKEIEQGTPLVKVRDKINAQAQELAAARALLESVLPAITDKVGYRTVAESVRAFLKGGK